MQMPTRTYEGVTADVPQLVTDLRERLERDDFEVLSTKTGLTVVLQARKAGKVRDLTGMSYALTVRITPQDGGTVVEVGKQKWMDKAAIGAISMIALWPLAVPAAAGAYWQYQITDEVWKIIEAHMARRSVAPSSVAVLRCGECGASARGGSAHCPQCGAPIRFERRCDGCDNNLDDPSARFCNRCGKRIEAAV